MADITYADVNRLLRQAEATQDAAEFHGTLCGRLCADEQISPPAPDVAPAFAQLQDEALEGLRDAEAGFQPLLPDDDIGLPERVYALAQWCAGFVFGIGSSKQLDLDNLSDDAREIVADMTEISRADASAEDAESDEAAYAEVLEYVRVGAQLVFLEVRTKHANPAAPTLH